VTSWWYPGFLPGNTFTVSDRGLAWGVDALPVPAPPEAPGRAFTARAMQRSGTLAGALDCLRRHPTAGGFAYVMCELATARVAVAESGGGLLAVTEPGPAGCPLVWHTNHFRYAGAALPPGPGGSSCPRGQVLGSVAPGEVSRDYLLGLMARDPLPRGVRQPGTGDVLTLCTLIVDQRAGLATLASAAGTVITVPAADLAAGDPARATVTRLAREAAGAR
jgi:hypothetical protein